MGLIDSYWHYYTAVSSHQAALLVQMKTPGIFCQRYGFENIPIPSGGVGYQKEGSGIVLTPLGGNTTIAHVRDGVRLWAEHIDLATPG